MQDRFKFRVWLKNEKRYGYLLNLFNCGSNSQYEVEEYDEPGDHYTVYSADEVVLQQCTGLKDKNGKLIFEGDIVREYNGYGYVMTEEVVFVEDVMFGFNINVEFDYEIIGNIYENPELLEEK